MALAWFHWWWDPIGLSRGQVLTGAISAVLAVFAIVYAWRVARRQFAVMDEQTAISKRQMELAKKQDEIIQDQLSKKTDLRVRSRLQHKQFGSEGDKPLAITLNVLNGGNKAADGFHWEVFIPRELAFLIKFIDDDDNEIPGQFAPFSETEIYDKADGHYAHKLFPTSSLNIVRVTVNADHPRMQEFTLKWRIHCEDRMVPSKGLAEIRYKRVPDGTYAVMHPWPPSEEPKD